MVEKSANTIGPPSPAFPKNRHSRRLAWELPLGAGLLIAHFVLLTLMLNGSLDFAFNDARHRLGPGTDFAAQYGAAKQWQAGNGLYGHGPGFGYRHHPVFVITVGRVLSSLELRAAHLTWVYVNEALLFISLVYVRRLRPDARHFLTAAVLLTVFSPYYLEVYMGNSTFVAATLLLIAFDFYRRKKAAPFLILFVTSILIKPLGLVFLPILLVRRQFAAVVIVLAAVVGTALPYFLLDPAGWRSFWKVNTEAVPLVGWVIHAGNQGLHGLAVTLCTRSSGIWTGDLESYQQLPGVCQLLLAGLPILLVAISLVATWRLRHEPSAAIFLWSATYLLGYKDIWEHSYSLLLVGLVYLWASRRINRTLFLLCAVALALPTAFLIYDLPLPSRPLDPEHYWDGWTAAVHHATKPLWLLILYVACATAALRPGSRPRNAESEPAQRALE